MEKTYRLLLKQNIGQAAEPVVNVGETVERGQCIGRVNGVGAALHASVSGVVQSIDEQAISIAAFEQQPTAFRQLPQSLDIVSLVKEAGIVGMGGAGFPTHIKLNSPLQDGMVIANGVECEPVLHHNIQRMEQQAALICNGLRYAMQAVGAASGRIAVKEKNSRAILALRAALRAENAIQVVGLADLYPMGEERAIVREVLGKTLSPDQLPAAAGAVVCNVETLLRIAEAAEQRRPCISKDITVAGRLNGAVSTTVLQDVPIGTRVGDLIDAAGGIRGEYGEIIMGGPFTGKSVGLDDVITKTSGGLIVTLPVLAETRKLGLLVCACGAAEERLREIAAQMGAPVVAVERCKQAVDVRGSLKCENPGNCPGQAEKVLKLRKNGAEALLISNCSDCSNTVMGVAPKLKMPVHHHTDHVMRTMGLGLVRRLKE